MRPLGSSLHTRMHHHIIGTLDAAELAHRERGHVGERVDLSVRVGDGGTHLRPAVLEHEDVRHVGARSEHARAFSPQVDDPAGAVVSERGERRVVVRRVQHDLGAAVRERRPTVREPVDLVGLGRLEPPGQKGHAAEGRLGRSCRGSHDDDRGAGEGVDTRLAHATT